MRETDASKSRWQIPSWVIEGLTCLLGFGVLVSVPIALILGQTGVLPDSDIAFYVTRIAVPLLTFAGFLAVYLGFLSQREQNDLQREQLEQQQANFQKDRFESTFFQLLRTQNQIVNDIRCEETRLWLSGSEGQKLVEIRGRSCFAYFYDELEELFGEKADKYEWEDRQSLKGGEERNPKSKMSFVYENWFSKRKSEVGHYFSHLAKVISFVHRSNRQDKGFYIGLLRAQMSQPELKLFFYHISLRKEVSGHEHLKQVYGALGAYTFFKAIDRNSLIDEKHTELYPEALGL